MNRKTLLALAGLGAFSQCWAVPIVSNVRMEQIVGTKDVRITYDLADNVNTQLWMDVSVSPKAYVENWGSSTLPVKSVDGDAFRLVAPGRDRTLIWHAGLDWNGRYTDMAQAVVRAKVPDFGFCKDRNLAFSWDSCWRRKRDASGGWDNDRCYLYASYSSGSVRTRVMGPGTISFYWAKSSSYSSIAFMVDGSTVYSLTSSTATSYSPISYTIKTSGLHEIRWYFTSSYGSSLSYGYLDCIEWKEGL